MHRHLRPVGICTGITVCGGADDADSRVAKERRVSELYDHWEGVRALRPDATSSKSSSKMILRDSGRIVPGWSEDSGRIGKNWS